MSAAPAVGRAFAAYSALRLVLFVMVCATLYLVGLRDLPLVGTAVIVSAILSLIVLRQQREELARAVAARDEDRREARAAQRARLAQDTTDDGEHPATS